MWGQKSKQKIQNLELELSKARDVVESVWNHNACIAFSTDGTIIDVNQAFLDVVGYTKEQVIGQHHRMFCSPRYVDSAAYKKFWTDLAAGRLQSGSFQRQGRQGRKIWLQASYFPVSNGNAPPYKIVKIVQDITRQEEERLSQKAILSALDRSLAVIEFYPDGTIAKANDNFLRTMQYSMDEIVGKHHRMFCDDQFYRDQPYFWKELARGDFKSGKYQRRNRRGDTVWLEATYNPVFDDDNNVIRVIKFASDITARALADIATQQAAEIANSTSEKTAQIAVNGTALLKESVAISEAIAGQIVDAASLISQLNTKSSEISAIVTTISSIADQTNLLALNAAIEAARAGEHGRGFAVVADEVRNLASRTNTSTVEIDEMVRGNEGLTQQAMDRMKEVGQQARAGSELINRAAGVIEEIRLGAENVSKTVAALAR